MPKIGTGYPHGDPARFKGHTGGKKGRKNIRGTKAATAFATALLSRPRYRRKFLKDWDDRKVHPAIETLVIQLKYPKPKDEPETTPAPNVVIVHERLKQ